MLQPKCEIPSGNLPSSQQEHHIPLGLTWPLHKRCNLLQRLFQESKGCNLF